MTLPLIHALNKADSGKRHWLINSVKNHNLDKVRVRQVIDYVKESGGLDYAVEKMKSYQDQALELLQEYPSSPYKEALELMVNYVIDRKK